MEKMGEGIRIHISSISKELLDMVGGFRCDYRGALDLGVTCFLYQISFSTQLYKKSHFIGGNIIM